MAKHRPVKQDLAGVRNPSASPSTHEPIVEYDAAVAARRATAPVASALATSDTMVPHPDLFAARDELKKLFGPTAARTAAATETVEAPGGMQGLENIVGFGVGLRFTSQNPTGEVAAKVYVREKLSLAKVEQAAQVPPTIGGLPVDVEAIGEVRKAMYGQVYKRPVPCGVSICNVKLKGSGTLAALVVLENNNLCILSNNHVMALENAGLIGDAIIQPGKAEPGANSSLVIAHLLDFVELMATGNEVDAAVAWTTFNQVRFNHVTYDLNPDPVQATIGMMVIKNGRTSEATSGIITDLGVSFPLRYDPFPQGAEMVEQLIIRGIGGGLFATQGDSGSLVVTANTKQPVGLFFATGANDICFANRIDLVMKALNINRFYTDATG